MIASKITPRFVDKEVTTVEKVRDGVTLELGEVEARKLKALLGRLSGAFAEVYFALDHEYPGRPYEVVQAWDARPAPPLDIREREEKTDA